MQEEQSLDKAIEKADEVSDTLSDSSENQESFTALTGKVLSLESTDVEDADIKELRKAVFKSRINKNDLSTDEELRSEIQETRHDSIIKMEVGLVEDDGTEEYAWFTDDFPEDNLLAVTGVDSVEKLLRKNVPMIQVHDKARFSFEPYRLDPADTSYPKYVALGMQEHIKAFRDEDAKTASGALAFPFTFFAMTLYSAPILWLFTGISGIIATAGFVGFSVLIAFLIWTIGCYRRLWPNDRRYARQLKPDAIQSIEDKIGI